jgi:putative transposase
LKEVDGGGKVQEVCRRLGISDQTLYNWRRKYGGLEVSEVRRLKTLDDENKKLKHVFAEQLLEITAIRAALEKNGNA